MDLPYSRRFIAPFLSSNLKRCLLSNNTTHTFIKLEIVGYNNNKWAPEKQGISDLFQITENEVLLHAVPESIFIFPDKIKQVMGKVGEDSYVSLCSNTPVSLTFSDCVGNSSSSHFSDVHTGQHNLLTFTNSSGYDGWNSISRNTNTNTGSCPLPGVTYKHVIALTKISQP